MRASWAEVVSNSVTDSNDKTITVSCTAGPNKVLGGGYRLSGIGGTDARKIVVATAYPSSPTTWTLEAYESANVTASWTLTAYAICGVA